MRPASLRLWMPIFIFFILVLFPRPPVQSTPEPPLPPPTPETETSTQVRQAILNAVTLRQEDILAFLVNDVQVQQVDVSDSGEWAVGFLTLTEAQTGEPIPSEPSLAIARRTNSGWDVFLPTDPYWLDLLITLPDDLIDPQTRQVYIEMNADYGLAPSAVYPGYRLPWAAGQTAWLSGSTSHDSYIPSGNAHYAFDFYIPQTMYRLYASKAGVVWRAKWDTPNGDDSSTGNYLVLQDNTTSPVTYQLYLHLAQDSIPAALRQRGAYVVQGQYIGMADDTGQSTGHHLHFQVHTNPDSYWGRAVDITFEDVGINGGRPRVKNGWYNDQKYCWPSDACSSFQSSYVSGNVVRGDVTPPTGDLFEPTTGTTINNKIVHVEGWASDVGSGLDKAQLISFYQNSWHAIGPQFSSLTFSLDWDMCAAKVPNGPVSLALRIWDKEGNPAVGLPGLRHIIKDHPCDSPPPAGVKPDANFITPQSGEYSNATGEIPLQVAVANPVSDIEKVEFYFHSGNWLIDPWQLVGSDINGQDGWTYNYNAAALAEQKEIAFYANVLTKSGNWKDIGVWDLGIDRTPPVTNLVQLPDQQVTNAVLLNWTATDNLSGLDYLNLQTQIGSGSWEKYSPDPSGASLQLWFIGNPGTGYGFRMRGVDRADNAENYPTSAESRTTIPPAAVLCSSPDSWDKGRNDNSASSAVITYGNSSPSTHNFCNPLDGGWANDEDWVQLAVQTGHQYNLRAVPTAEMVGVNLELYASDGTTLIRQAKPVRYGGQTLLTWNSDQAGTVYLRVRHQDGRVLGSAATYQLSVQEITPIFLPIVRR